MKVGFISAVILFLSRDFGSVMRFRSNFPRAAPNRRRLLGRVALDVPQSILRKSIFLTCQQGL